jgi:NAD-dependent dihydropyrimidine dehydrogenase PreA subunit
LLPLLALSWGLSLSLFLCFPLYAPWLASRRREGSRGLLTLERGGLPALLWGICLVGLLAYGALYGTLSWGFAVRWGLATLVLSLLLTVDLTGCTPLYKSGLQEDRLLHVVLDPTRCRGAAFCEQVCPRGCFTVDHIAHTAQLSNPARCVRCGACIVQCPFDALQFVDASGKTIPPQTVRRYKLNLMGKRSGSRRLDS